MKGMSIKRRAEQFGPASRAQATHTALDGKAAGLKAKLAGLEQAR
jgi:hypothetical protein